MGLRLSQGDERRFLSSNRSPWKRRPSLCHPERSRGICSSADHSWKCFFDRAAQWSDLQFTSTHLHQPVLRKPAEIPLMVAERARLMASELSPSRLRRKRSTWIRLIGST